MGRSCLINLIFFYDKETQLGNEGKAVYVDYLGSSKVFEIVFPQCSHRSLQLSERKL